MTADAMRDYLDAISRYPLLTTQQEIQLARKIAQYMELRDNPAPTPADRADRAGVRLSGRGSVVLFRACGQPHPHFPARQS